MSNINAYEILYYAAMLVSIAVFIVVPCIRNKKFDAVNVLKAACVCALIHAIYSALTVGQTIITSDTATASILAKSQLRHKSFFPKTWVYGHSDLWVISTNLFVLPLVEFMENQTLARVLASAIYIVLTALVMVWSSKVAKKDESWTLSIPICFVFLAGSYNWMLYEAAYVGGLFGLAVVPALYYLTLSTERKKCITARILLAIYLCLQCMGGTRAFAELILPVICIPTWEVFWRIQKGEKLKDKLKGYLLSYSNILIPSVLGILLNHMILKNGYMAEEMNVDGITLVSSLQEVADNIRATLINFFTIFGFYGDSPAMEIKGLNSLLSVALCVLIVFVMPLISILRYKKQDEFTKQFIIFGGVHNLIILVLVLFCKDFMLSDRYLLTSVFICTFLFSWELYRIWKEQNNITAWILVAAAVIVIIFRAMLVPINKGWMITVEARKSECAKLVERGLTKGYTNDYWTAYSTEVYTDMKVDIAACTVSPECASPWAWLVDSSLYEAEDKNTFLMLDPETNETISPTIAANYGEPIEILGIANSFVYVFDHDIADDFYNGLSDNRIGVNELLYNENVQKDERQLKIQSSGIVYGPGWEIEQGKYKVVYEGNSLDNVTYDIHSEKNQGGITYSEKKRNDGKIEVELNVNGVVSDVEFRVFNESGQEVVLSEIVVEKEL